MVIVAGQNGLVKMMKPQCQHRVIYPIHNLTYTEESRQQLQD